MFKECDVIYFIPTLKAEFFPLIKGSGKTLIIENF